MIFARFNHITYRLNEVIKASTKDGNLCRINRVGSEFVSQCVHVTPWRCFLCQGFRNRYAKVQHVVISRFIGQGSGYRNFLVRKVVRENHSKTLRVTKWKAIRVCKYLESRGQEFSVLLFQKKELKVPVHSTV
jgi:hypothetical protein